MTRFLPAKYLGTVHCECGMTQKRTMNEIWREFFSCKKCGELIHPTAAEKRQHIRRPEPPRTAAVRLKEHFEKRAKESETREEQGGPNLAMPDTDK